MASSSSSPWRDIPSIIILLHVLGRGPSSQAAGLSARRAAVRDPPASSAAAWDLSETTKFNTPQAAKAESSSGRANSACGHSCLMSCSDFERRSDIPNTERVGVSLTEISRKSPWSCRQPAQAFQKQLAPLSPLISAHSTSWA